MSFHVAQRTGHIALSLLMLQVYPVCQLPEQKSWGRGGNNFVCLWFFFFLVGFLLSLSDCLLFSSLSMISDMLFILPNKDCGVVLNDLQLFCARRERHAN